jgi:hypothetical protein
MRMAYSDCIDVFVVEGHGNAACANLCQRTLWATRCSGSPCGSCTGRIASLVEAVRSIARQERAELADIDVHEQIRSALDVLNQKLKNARITQNFSSECGHVRGYPSELAQVWVNLLDNAADAVNGGGKITIQTLRDDNQTVVEIIDNGPGISSENLSHIFEPFFTTKGVGSGKGRFHFLKLLRQLRHIRASRDDCLGAFVSFNLSHGQSHDESRFTCLRFDLDLTAVPVSDNALAYRNLKRPPFLKEGLRQFSTSRFSLNLTSLSASVFRRELRFASREGR